MKGEKQVPDCQRGDVTIPDEALVRNFQNGDETAFLELYDRYKEAIYVYCLKMLGDADAAKDVVQGAFVKVFERRLQIEYPERFRSWLFAIVRNDCLSCLRDEKSVEATPELLSAWEEQSALEQRSQTDSERLLKLVAKAISSLPPDYREALILREYQQFSYKEIAEMIGASEAVVKFRLFTARRRLYELLKPLLRQVKNHELP